VKISGKNGQKISGTKGASFFFSFSLVRKEGRNDEKTKKKKTPPKWEMRAGALPLT
jgi:hypothetical protein